MFVTLIYINIYVKVFGETPLPPHIFDFCINRVALSSVVIMRELIPTLVRVQRPTRSLDTKLHPSRTDQLVRSCLKCSK